VRRDTSLNISASSHSPAKESCRTWCVARKLSIGRDPARRWNLRHRSRHQRGRRARLPTHTSWRCTERRTSMSMVNAGRCRVFRRIAATPAAARFRSTVRAWPLPSLRRLRGANGSSAKNESGGSCVLRRLRLCHDASVNGGYEWRTRTIAHVCGMARRASSDGCLSQFKRNRLTHALDTVPFRPPPSTWVSRILTAATRTLRRRMRVASQIVAQAREVWGAPTTHRHRISPAWNHLPKLSLSRPPPVSACRVPNAVQWQGS